MASFADSLPDNLRAAAYLSEGGEAAWSREDTSSVIDRLRVKGLVVCGIEIWLPTKPGPTIPTPYIYSWEIEPRSETDLWIDFMERANERAKEYVQLFQWDQQDFQHQDAVPYFNLLICNEQDLKK